MTPVRTNERPERHFADSFATVRIGLQKVVGEWMAAFLKRVAGALRPTPETLVIPLPVTSTENFRQ